MSAPGFVGFDAERIGWLRSAAGRVVGDLRTIRSADPAASTACNTVSAVLARLEGTWLPTFDRLVATADLVSIVRSGADDLVGLLGDEPFLTRFATVLLDASADPLSSAALRELLDAHGVDLLAHLAGERLRLEQLVLVDPDDPVTVARLAAVDRVLAGVGATLVAGQGQGHRAAAPPLLDDLDPYTAALVLPHLGLTGTLLGETAARIVRRWHEPPVDELGWPDEHVEGANTFDHVVRTLLDDPAAAMRFLDQVADRPEMLVIGAARPESTTALLGVALDPAAVDAARAGAVIVPLVDWLRGEEVTVAWVHGDDDGLARRLVADLLADWILYAGPRAEDWPWRDDDGGDGDAALAWLAEDATALTALVDRLVTGQGMLAGTSFVREDGRVDDRLVAEQTGMFAQLERVIGTQLLADAEATERWVDLGFRGAELLAGRLLLPGVGGIAGSIVDRATAYGSDRVRSFLERERVLPASAEQVAERLQEEQATRRVERAVIATTTLVGQLVELGELPASVFDDLDALAADVSGDCPSRAMARLLHDWTNQIAPQLPIDRYNLVIAVRNGFLNERDVDDACS